MIKNTIEAERGRNKPFIFSRVKEAIQDYLLHFVYSDSDFKRLIFTGGTCLRKVYGLPRLSEDIDFDFVGKFQIEKFSAKIKNYFAGNLQYKSVETKLANNSRTVFIKFPRILNEVGMVKSAADRQQLFVRCDFAKEDIGFYQTEVHPIFTREFTFFVNAYDLPTMFANKIIAFLGRDFFRGRDQEISFKGRDLFDLVWLIELAQKRQGQLVPRWERILAALKISEKKDVIDRVAEKVKKINPRDVQRDLVPFIESENTIKTFGEHFVEIIINGLKMIP
ncbi:nucleotidyl transferase AbiEii/AbiGii toxin family protein [Candidatus Collierbacteria bacterium]|nr:nucleotidyl transferase AbiEii/AbiGii toxin family protein [Candidatus Collierbacteria bacterium]